MKEQVIEKKKGRINRTTGEIMLTVLSAMAQQEGENISSHVKLGLQMKLKRGELIGYNGCLGYYKRYLEKRKIYLKECLVKHKKFYKNDKGDI